MKRMKTISVFFLLFLGLIGMATADGVEDDLSAALNRIADKHYQQLMLSFGTFTYEQSGIAGPFSRYLEEKLTTAIGNADKCDLFVHDALESMDISFKEVFGGHISEAGVTHLIEGTYNDTGNTVTVTLKVTDFTTGVMIGTEKIIIPKRVLPSYAALVPVNYDTAVNIMRDIGDVLSGRHGGLVVRATTTRGNGATYRNGEEFLITLAASKDCFIKIYHFNLKGEMKLIFPDAGDSNFLKARTLYTIPDPDYFASFVVEPPFGVEQIKVVASTKQFDYIEPAFVPLQPGRDEKPSDFIAMDLGRKPRKNGKTDEGLKAEASVVYTTMP
jgi:hypothetical protein